MAKILAAVDSQATATKFLGLLELLGGTLQHSELTLLHVIPPLEAYMAMDLAGAMEPDPTAYIHETSETAAEWLSVFRKEFNRLGLVVHVHITTGFPGPEICRHIKGSDYTLVMVGRRGLGLLGGLLLGSVSEYVLRHGDIPVLIVQ